MINFLKRRLLLLSWRTLAVSGQYNAMAEPLKLSR
jgi:hypothetical protein